MRVTPLPHGWDDRNVAIAWTQWLLREDDSPKTIMDAVMNGLAAGCVCGGAIDLTRLMSRPPDVFVWTRRGAFFGLILNVVPYCLHQSGAISPQRLVPDSTSRSSTMDAVMGDPWARQCRESK